MNQFSMKTFRVYINKRLLNLENYRIDGLITIEQDKIAITEQGLLFARLICKTFDQYSNVKGKQIKLSKAI